MCDCNPRNCCNWSCRDCCPEWFPYGCKPLWNFIKIFDIFGHPVQLNFNKNGRTHKTILGGMGSLGFYAAAIIILIITFAKPEDQCRKQDQICGKAMKECASDKLSSLCSSGTTDCDAQTLKCSEQKGTDATMTESPVDGIQRQIVTETYPVVKNTYTVGDKFEIGLGFYKISKSGKTRSYTKVDHSQMLADKKFQQFMKDGLIKIQFAKQTSDQKSDTLELYDLTTCGFDATFACPNYGVSKPAITTNDVQQSVKFGWSIYYAKNDQVQSFLSDFKVVSILTAMSPVFSGGTLTAKPSMTVIGEIILGGITRMSQRVAVKEQSDSLGNTVFPAYDPTESATILPSTHLSYPDSDSKSDKLRGDGAFFSQEVYLSSTGLKYKELSFFAAGTSQEALQPNTIGDAIAMILIVFFLCKIFFGAIAEHAFAVKAMNRMCMVRSMDDEMLAHVKLEVPCCEHKEEERALKYNRITVQRNITGALRKERREAKSQEHEHEHHKSSNVKSNRSKSSSKGTGKDRVIRDYEYEEDEYMDEMPRGSHRGRGSARKKLSNVYEDEEDGYDFDGGEKRSQRGSHRGERERSSSRGDGHRSSSRKDGERSHKRSSSRDKREGSKQRHKEESEEPEEPVIADRDVRNFVEINQEIKKDVLRMHRMKIGCYDSFWLFFKNICCGFHWFVCQWCRCHCCCFAKKFELYLQGRTKVESEMDIVKIMRRLRFHDIALKSSILESKVRRLQTRYARKYALEVDSRVESENEDYMNNSRKAHDEIHESLNMKIIGAGERVIGDTPGDEPDRARFYTQSLHRLDLAINHHDIVLKFKMLSFLRGKIQPKSTNMLKHRFIVSRSRLQQDQIDRPKPGYASDPTEFNDDEPNTGRSGFRSGRSNRHLDYDTRSPQVKSRKTMIDSGQPRDKDGDRHSASPRRSDRNTQRGSNRGQLKNVLEGQSKAEKRVSYDFDQFQKIKTNNRREIPNRGSNIKSMPPAVHTPNGGRKSKDNGPVGQYLNDSGGEDFYEEQEGGEKVIDDKNL